MREWMNEWQKTGLWLVASFNRPKFPPDPSTSWCFVCLLWGEPSAFLEAPIQVIVPSSHGREGERRCAFLPGRCDLCSHGYGKGLRSHCRTWIYLQIFLDNILWCGYYSWYLSVFAEVDTEMDECSAVHLIPGTSFDLFLKPLPLCWSVWPSVAFWGQVLDVVVTGVFLCPSLPGSTVGYCSVCYQHFSWPSLNSLFCFPSTTFPE